MAPRKTAPAGSQTAGKSSRTQPDRRPRTRAGQEVRKALATGPNGGTAATGSVLKGAGKNAAMPVRSAPPLSGKAQVHSSSLSYKGKVFDVTTDTVTEPGGVTSTRDVIRHSGSVVILAVDASVNPADPTILIERQYRHAAGKFLLELPAGRIEPGENPLAAAKRELIEETGFRARRWSKLVRYYASPGFLAEHMQVFLAQEIREGVSEPEADELIELQHIPLSQLLAMIHAGKIEDAKTLLSVLLYASLQKKNLGSFA